MLIDHSRAAWTGANPQGSHDGAGAGDRDLPYTFDRHLSTRDIGPFSARQFARLLCLRSHVQDGERVPPEVFYVATGMPECFDDNCGLCQAFIESVEAA